jgi:hypothetical protein
MSDFWADIETVVCVLGGGLKFGVIVVRMLMESISNITMPCKKKSVKKNIFNKASIFPVLIKHDTK